MTIPTAESRRLADNDARRVHWSRWGPYLSARAWGTVREDYSADGTAWDSFPQEHAPARAYRWNEDGLLGLCDRHQLVCFAIALWNGKDPVLKERPFGLSNSQGNHGEDVKDYWFYLDATPTASYLRALYKYPQAEFPYRQLLEENARRTIEQPEYELADTGIFADGRYFDVVAEYAKASPEDILIAITVANRGPEAATLDLLPTVWFRNTWWKPGRVRPNLRAGTRTDGRPVVELSEAYVGRRYLHAEPGGELLFTENDTNTEKIFGVPNGTPFVKDAFHELVIHGRTEAVNPARLGTKAAVRYRLSVPAGASARIRLRLTDDACVSTDPLSDEFESTFAQRRTEADEYYSGIIPAGLSPDERNVMRQALAGMIWSKQFYQYDVRGWLDGDPEQPAPPPGVQGRAKFRLAARLQPRMSSPCRIRGSIPGSPRGIWPFTPSSLRPHRSRFRQAATLASAHASGTCTPTASCRRMSALQRRESSGACVGRDAGLTRWRTESPGGRPRISRRVFDNCC